jgi:serine/threonine protein kinase
MAREITILRRLDHPNIMKLEGIITSRMSNSLYLVFEYMEHDLAGLVSRPDIVFTDSQVCYHLIFKIAFLNHIICTCYLCKVDATQLQIAI